MTLKSHIRIAGTVLSAVLVTAVMSVPAAWAGSLVYPYIYRSPRIIAMGGAYVAIGGDISSVFHNPAGLSRMPLNEWDDNVVDFSFSNNGNATDFINDLSDSLETGDANGDGKDTDDQLKAVNSVLKGYRGENIHLYTSNLTSVAKNNGDYSFSVSGLVSASLEAIPHQGYGSDGLIDIEANMHTGIILGASQETLKGLHTGIALKFLNREAISHSFTAAEIVENEANIAGLIQDDHRENGTAIGIDAGIIYSFWKDSKVKPSLGLSVMDIGGTDFGAAGSIPMTVNVGVSATGHFDPFETLTVGFDYVDLQNNYEGDDWGKRLRIGGELVLKDTKAYSAALRAGLYQGYVSYGVEYRTHDVKLTYTSYAEELGAYAGQSMNRRQMLALFLGWS